MKPLREFTSVEIVQMMMDLPMDKFSEVLQALAIVAQDAQKRGEVISKRISNERLAQFYDPEASKEED